MLLSGGVFVDGVVGPVERFRPSVVIGDVIQDRVRKVGRVGELGGRQQLTGQNREPHLNLVQPRRVCWCPVQECSGVGIKERFDAWGVVSGQVVDDAVQFEMRWHLAVKVREELNEID